MRMKGASLIAEPEGLQSAVASNRPVVHVISLALTATIEVRPAEGRDSAVVIELLAAQLAEHSLASGGEQVARGIEVAFQTGASLLVALEGSRVVGACLANRIASVEHGGAVLFIEELYVVPEARRRGVARALLGRLVSEAAASGVRAIELEVDEGHEPARALYRSLGFEANKRTPWVLDLRRVASTSG
jgi:ribosomal protein S18 acetylase RimI-like enzyme